MKTKILLFAVLLVAIQSTGQDPVLHWKFSNDSVYYNGTHYVFGFDVMASCDLPGTFHRNMLVGFTYSHAAFGDSICQFGKIQVWKGELLQGNAGGGPIFSVALPVCSDPNAVGIEITHSGMNAGEGMPSLPVWGQLLRIEIELLDHNQVAGIEFLGEYGGTGFMNGSQYYVDAVHPTPTLYGEPPGYAGVYENDMLQRYLVGPNPVFYWRFANGFVQNNQYVVDVEVRTTHAGTFLMLSRFSMDYNPMMFGANIYMNNHLTVEKLDILAGDVSGTPRYNIVNISDNNGSRMTMLVENAFVIVSPQYMNEVDTVWKGYCRLKIDIDNPSFTNPGIFFVPEMMDNAQTYGTSDQNGNTYGDPPHYACMYVNNMAGFTPCGILSGVVKDDATADPVHTAVVYTDENGTCTNAAGQYQFYLPCGAHQVTADHPCYLPDSVMVTMNYADTLWQEFLLTDDPMGIAEIFGYVTDEDNDTIQEAVVQVGDSIAFTNADGWYWIRIVEGEYAVSATAPGYCMFSDTLLLECGSPCGLNITLQGETGTLNGAITDCLTGAGMEGLMIQLGSFTDTTDIDGSYEITGIDPGGYQFVLDAPGFVNTPIVIDVEITACETVTIDTCLLPLPPVILQDSVNCETVHLTWNDPAPGWTTGFNIYRNNVLLEFTADTSATYTGQQGQCEYCVTACYPEGESNPSCATVNNGPCLPPEDLEIVSAGWTYVSLEWNAPEFGEWITWCDLPSAGGNGIGMTGGGTFRVASRWEPEDIVQYNGWYLKTISFYWYFNAPEATFILKAWKGIDAAVELLSQEVTDGEVGEWNEITLDTLVEIDATTEFWFGYEVTHGPGSNPAATDFGPAIAGKGDMINSGDFWESMSLVYGLDYNFALHGCVSPFPGTAKPEAQKRMSSTVNETGADYKLSHSMDPDFKPGNLPGKSNVLTGYNIYRKIWPYEWELVGSTGSGITWYTDVLPYTPYEAWWYLTADYVYGESPPSNQVLWVWCDVVEENSSTLRIYPIPAKDFINIELGCEIEDIALMNGKGKTVFSVNGVRKETFSIDVSGFTPGVYLLKIVQPDEVISRKMIIR